MSDNTLLLSFLMLLQVTTSNVDIFWGAIYLCYIRCKGRFTSQRVRYSTCKFRNSVPFRATSVYKEDKNKFVGNSLTWVDSDSVTCCPVIGLSQLIVDKTFVLNPHLQYFNLLCSFTLFFYHFVHYLMHKAFSLMFILISLITIGNHGDQ